MTQTQLARVPLQSERPRTARDMLRVFIEKVIADAEDEIETAAIIAYARKRFERSKEFHLALLDEALGVLVSDVLRGVLHEQREALAAEPLGRPVAVVPDDDLTKERLDQRAREIFAKMYESLGGTRRKSLLSMSRPELLAAAEIRDKQANGHLRWATFERDLAAQLPDDEQTVGDALTDADLDAVLKRHFTPNAA